MTLSVEEVTAWTTMLVVLVIIPGEALCLMGLIACRGAWRYVALLFGFSLLAALIASLVSTSLSQTFVPPRFLESFYSEGVWRVNPKYHPALPQLLCAVAVVSAAFGVAVHQARSGRRRTGAAFLVVACSALSAVAVWVWTVGSLYGYRALAGG